MTSVSAKKKAMSSVSRGITKNKMKENNIVIQFNNYSKARARPTSSTFQLQYSPGQGDAP